jgi:predicted metal-dependent enzyme (double-stranded beta helix superfamily)
VTKPSMDGTDPATWDPSLDGILAAPDNHKILYEDDTIRVVSVSVAPGAIEKPHHHRFPSVFVIDRMVKLRDFNGATGEEIPLPIPKDVEFPIVVKFLPQPLHYVENVDTVPFHATRIEFKRGFPTGA